MLNQSFAFGRIAIRETCLAALVAICALAGTASAAPIINVGSHDLQENTPGQVIYLQVTGTEDVTGFNLRAQIGDGTGPNAEPVFEAIGFGGGMWDAHPNTKIGDGPVVSAEQFAQYSVAFNQNTPAYTATADGLLVSLTVDTTGFFDGDSFDLLLKDTQIGADSDLVVIGGGTLAPEITNGTINVVPEPATMSLLALGSLMALRRRKK